MTKKVRKPRTKLINKVDLLIPLNLNVIGTPNDPCFGILNDPQNDTCRRCGDCEVCAIVQGQKLHLKRAVEESKGNFKDLEEEKITSLTPSQKARKLIKLLLKDGPVLTSTIIERVKVGLKLGDSRVEKIIQGMIDKKRISRDKTKLKLP